MAYCRLVFPLLVLSVLQSYASVQVPAFLWGDLATTSLQSNPLTKLSVEKFDGVIKKELQDDPFTVIFIEETLSVEDLSRKDADGDTSYPYLHANIGDALYIPSVDDPLRVLNKLADPEKVNHVKLTENGLSAEIKQENGKFLFINLKDAREGESRAELLRRHNDFMEDTFTKLQEQHDRVVAIYTAHYPSWTIPESHSRVRRQAVTQINDWALNGVRIYAKALLFEDGVTVSDLKASPLLSNSTEINDIGNQMNATLNFESNSITMHFVNRLGYWLFNTVTLVQKPSEMSHQLIAETELYALLRHSYRCGQNVSFSSINDTRHYKLTFQNMQIQPFFNTSNTEQLFGESFDCVGFFSVAIWAGLFVTFILLSITFYGIMMMMDIRTMDRFDDPKGKTITINASE